MERVDSIEIISRQACDDYRDEFLRLVKTGESSEAFLRHTEYCPKCGGAIEEAFNVSAKAFEGLAEALKKLGRDAAKT